MVRPLCQFLSDVASFAKADTIQLVQVHIQWELIAHFFRAFQETYRHPVHVVVEGRICEDLIVFAFEA